MKLRNGWKLLALAVVGLAAPAGLLAADPAAAEEPKLWKQTPDEAQVLAATFVGGKGNEWLVGGGFQPDGTVVLAGNVAGPTLDLSVPVEVIGTDLPAPPPAEPVVEMTRGKKGPEPKLDKQGKQIIEKPSWRHPGVTGFVVRMSPDMKKVISAHRLPWTSGAITSCAVGNDGAIYIAGRATDQIGKLGGHIEALGPPPLPEKAEGRCDHSFVARLSPDAAKSEWVLHYQVPSDAPEVVMRPDGNVRFTARDVRILNPAGKAVREVSVPGGAGKTTSVSPLDDTVIVAGEHHSPTGREPWRCPTMNVYHADGSLRYQLYDWGGPYVGLDNLRLVSDSAVRQVTHDKDGGILLYAWSDGGNSVMTRQPADVRTGVAQRGLGLTLAGAGVLSAAYLIRIDPADYRVTGWTAWLAMLGPNKPNSTWIDNMAIAGDGSVLISGRTARGLWQTRNKLGNGPSAGNYIAILRPVLSAVRFSSLVPGAGVTEASYDRAAWGIASGMVDGKPRALFVCGAVADETSYDTTTATPTASAAQSKFGGGWSDGYAVLLDLSAPPPAATPGVSAEPIPPLAQGSANFERNAGGKGKKKNDSPPADGTTFRFSPDVPKWVTVDAEVRDQAGKKWPTFLYGKPVEGQATVKGGSLAANLTVACTSATQIRGDQSRRVLGKLYPADGPPPFKFTLESIGAAKTMNVTSRDAKGKEQQKSIEYSEGKGTIELAGKRIAVAPRITHGFGKTQGVYKGPGKYSAPAESVRITAWMTLKASELGLKALPADAPVDVRITMSGLAPPTEPAPEKK